MSCVHIYYGDGKGKTTAALGLAMRARGAGMSVRVIRFLKSENSAEVRELAKLGIDETNADMRGFLKDMPIDKQKHEIEKQRVLLKNALGNNCDMLVLDEVLDLIALGIADEADVEKIIDIRGECEIVLTGRKPWISLADKADYITEMVCKKHPFEQCGLEPRLGIEY